MCLDNKSLPKTLQEHLALSENPSALLNQATLSKMALHDTNPALHMLSARPIFLDLAFSHLKYPPIQEEGKGLMGKIFSKFSIWGK